MRLSALILAALASAVAGITVPANATVLENGIGGTDSTFSLTGSAQVFEAYTNAHGTTPAQLADLQTELDVSGNASGSLVVTLWAGTLGGPTTQLATIATVADSTLGTSFGSPSSSGTGALGLLNIFNIQYLHGATGLTSGEILWIGYQVTGFSGHGQVVSLELNSAIPSGSAYYDAAIVTGDAIDQCVDNGVSPTCVSTNTSTGLLSDNISAPEPATLAVLGSALTGLGLIRRRNRRKVASKD